MKNRVAVSACGPVETGEQLVGGGLGRAVEIGDFPGPVAAVGDSPNEILSFEQTTNGRERGAARRKRRRGLGSQESSDLPSVSSMAAPTSTAKAVRYSQTSSTTAAPNAPYVWLMDPTQET